MLDRKACRRKGTESNFVRLEDHTYPTRWPSCPAGGVRHPREPFDDPHMARNLYYREKSDIRAQSAGPRAGLANNGRPEGDEFQITPANRLANRPTSNAET